MKTPLLALTATAFLLASVAATAADDNAITAGDLQQLCHGSDTTSKNVCRVFIVGVVQGIQLGLDMADRQAARACLPGTMSAAGLESAVKTQLDQKLQATPAAQEQSAASLISTIVVRTYPCKQPPH